MSDATRVAKLRAALVRIAGMPCTGRIHGCPSYTQDVCPKHVAESVLIDDDWDAPLDEPGYTAEMKGLGSTQ